MKKGKLIGQGRTAEIYALEDGKVLKLFRREMAHKSVEQEFHIGGIVAGCSIPVPRIYDLVQVEGCHGIVYELIQGQTMLKSMMANPTKISNLARQMSKLQHQINCCQVTSLPKQKDTLASFINRAKDLSVDRRQMALDHLDSLPDENYLCHGDFHPDNIMITETGPVIIDWLNATTGSPAGDVARTTLLIRDAALPPGVSGLKAGLLNMVRSRFYSSYIKQYMDQSNVSPQDVEDWLLPVAAARLSEGVPAHEKNQVINLVDKLLEKKHR